MGTTAEAADPLAAPVNPETQHVAELPPEIRPLPPLKRHDSVKLVENLVQNKVTNVNDVLTVDNEQKAPAEDEEISEGQLIRISLITLFR